MTPAASTGSAGQLRHERGLFEPGQYPTTALAAPGNTATCPSAFSDRAASTESVTRSKELAARITNELTSGIRKEQGLPVALVEGA
jgi:hypothetical protein